MKSQFRFNFLASALLLVAVGWLWSESTSLQGATPSNKKDAASPVEPDMHEFMEYVFQPTFKRLKPAMTDIPADNQTWKSIKSDSLVLAEGGNLLLLRQPREKAEDWAKHSVQVREFGGELYRAAKAKDYTLARKNYESMVQHCNACHQQFAGGEHIQTP